MNPSSYRQSKASMPFTKIWHNNVPFVVCLASEIAQGRNRCGQCSKEFPKGVLAVIPFYIALKHREGWQFPNREKKSNDEPDFVPGPVNRLTTRYYCKNKFCIYKRFPYFRQELIQVPDDLDLKASHKKLLREQLMF